MLEALRALGVKAQAFKISVLDKAGLHTLVKTVERDVGVIDILINNAGVGQVVPLALMEDEDWDRMMSINVKGAFLTTQAVMRSMIHQKRGRILNISSPAGVKMMQAPVTTAQRKQRRYVGATTESHVVASRATASSAAASSRMS